MHLRSVVLSILFCSLAVAAQSRQKANPMELPGFNVPDEPKQLTPAATDFYDKKYKLRLHIPAGWNFTRRDGEISNFGVDTRNTHSGLEVRAVAAINYNPYPPTTFSGALVYYSVQPRSTPQACAAQSSSGYMKPLGEEMLSGVKFQHGRDNHGVGCIESRDDVFTAMRGGACLRFDLVVNTFCESSSGVHEIGPKQLGDIQTRLANILGSLHFDAK